MVLASDKAATSLSAKGALQFFVLGRGDLWVKNNKKSIKEETNITGAK